MAEIHFDGNGAVKVGGRNAQGKSSLLAAIESLLLGKHAVSSRPINDEATEGEIEGEWENITVHRRFKGNKTYLSVTNKDGAVFKGPQGLLDELVGKGASFDPLAFSRAKRGDQAAMLRKITGVDTTELDEKRAAVYEQRTSQGRDCDRVKGEFESMVLHPGKPKSLSTSDIADELREAMAVNAKHDDERESLGVLKAELVASEDALRAKHELIRDLEFQLAQARKDERELAVDVRAKQTARSEKEKQVAELKDVDVEPIHAKLRGVDENNAKARENEAYADAKQRLQESDARYNEFSATIKDIDQEKRDMLAAAKFPIDGLGFSEDGDVTYQGRPLDVASQAETIRIGTAIAMADNSGVKIVLIRDASLLDEASQKIVADMAEEFGFLVLMEVVTTDAGQCEILIEDGEVQ